jgi:hypothetical protein
MLAFITVAWRGTLSQVLSPALPLSPPLSLSLPAPSLPPPPPWSLLPPALPPSGYKALVFLCEQPLKPYTLNRKP